MGLSPTSGNAKDLFQYDPGCHLTLTSGDPSGVVDLNSTQGNIQEYLEGSSCYGQSNRCKNQNLTLVRAETHGEKYCLFLNE